MVDFPGGSVVKNLSASAGDMGLIPGVGGSKWQPTQVFLPGKSCGQRSLVGCRFGGHTESDTTEVT